MGALHTDVKARPRLKAWGVSALVSHFRSYAALVQLSWLHDRVAKHLAVISSCLEHINARLFVLHVVVSYIIRKHRVVVHAQGSHVRQVRWRRLLDSLVVSLSTLPFFLERWLFAENIILAKLDLDVSPVGLFIMVVVTILVILRIFLAKHIIA